MKNVFPKSERGAINIITLSLALPILLLIGAAAVDIVRLPIIKQQMYAALEAGASALPTTADSVESEESLKRSLALVVEDLTTGVGLFRHDKDQLSVKSGIYNLSVSPDGLVVGKEKVELLDARFVGAELSSSADLDRIVQQKFVTPKTIRLGHWVSNVPDGGEVTTDVPIAIFQLRLRAKDYFAFTKTLNFGVEVSESSSKDSAVLILTLIRPLSKAAELL